ncbi:MAG: hypothetical protein IPL50_12010 [Chitinophagaceae bacterium]|nr:hypothetical protein [Chitinophagaceae bacterium]
MEGAEYDTLQGAVHTLKECTPGLHCSHSPGAHCCQGRQPGSHL